MQAESDEIEKTETPSHKRWEMERSGAAVSAVGASNSRTTCLMNGSGGSLYLCSSGFHFHTEGAAL